MDVKRMHTFLTGLANNNNRDWLNANRLNYLHAKQNFIDLIGEVIKKTSVFDPEIANEDPKKCMFRLNRDIRFSKNKEPYKTNFGGSISEGGRQMGKPGYYIHIMPENNFVGGGLFQPIPDDLKKIRQEIDYNGDEMCKIIGSETFKANFKEPYDDKLKTTPRGYPKDHERIDLLRYKSFVYLRQFNDQEARSLNFLDMIQDTFKALKPYLDFLRRGLD